MPQKYHLNSKNKYAPCQATKRACRFPGTHINEKQYESLKQSSNTSFKDKVKELENWGVNTGTTGLYSILPQPRTIRRGINGPDNQTLKDLDTALDKFEEIEFTREEKNTMSLYTFTGNRYVNAYLWGGDEGLDAYNKKYAPKGLTGTKLTQYLEEERAKTKQNAIRQIGHLDTAFSKIKQTQTPKVLYRGFYLPKDYTGDVQTYIQEHFKEGETYSPKSYLSTSVDSDLMLAMSAKNPQKFFVLEIATKTDGLILHRKTRNQSSSVQESEREILLPRDMKFKISSVTKATYETTYEEGNSSGFSMFRTRIPQKKRFQVIQLVED